MYYKHGVKMVSIWVKNPCNLQTLKTVFNQVLRTQKKLKPFLTQTRYLVKKK